MLNNFLHRKYLYNGKPEKLGNIIIDLHKITNDQKKIDSYMAGLFQSQEPIKESRGSS